MAADQPSVFAQRQQLLSNTVRAHPFAGAVFVGTGLGSFAGSFPDGVTSVEGVPAPADVFVRARAPGTPFDGAVVGRATSSASGEWSIGNVAEDVPFDVVARKDGECDVVKSDVYALSPLRAAFPALFYVPIGASRTFPLTMHGGEGPYTYTVTSGPLPGGFSLVGGALVSSPSLTSAGDYTVTLDVEDARGAILSTQVIIRLMYIQLRADTDFGATKLLAPGDTVDSVVAAAGGYPPYTYAVATGALPPGIALDPSTGELSGTLGTPYGKWSFTISVTDAVSDVAYSPTLEIISSPFIPHKYWRLYVTAHNGNADVSVAELRFLPVFGSTAIPVQPATAFASSQYSSGYIPSYAFDSSLSSRWAASGSTNPVPVFIGNVLPVSATVGSVSITAANAGTPNNGPRDFYVQSSDDNATWTNEWYVSGQTGWGSNQVRTFQRPFPLYPGGESHTQWGTATVS